MKIMVLNSGSSSVKYQVIDMEDESVLARGIVERIGLAGSRLKHRKKGEEELIVEEEVPNHNKAIELILKYLTHPFYGVIKDVREINAVGHRVVHGGEKFTSSVLITDEVVEMIRECIPLAPLHNPANLSGIEAAAASIPHAPMVAVFDTAFHQTMPEYSYLYALPYELYEEKRIRRYGFHGTSHRYVSDRAAFLLKKPKEKLRIITAHLGNGASMTAVKYGKSIDTTMGYTPLEGLYMGTRCGNLDPAIPLALQRELKMSYTEVDHLLNKKSGMLGVSGFSSDMRDLEEAADKGNRRAKLALDMYAYMVKKYIGAYAAAMGGLDVLVFTAGIGENSWLIREKSCEGLEFIGIEIDPQKNRQMIGGKEGSISKDGSKVEVLVIPTNEELVIARDTKEIVESLKKH